MGDVGYAMALAIGNQGIVVQKRPTAELGASVDAKMQEYKTLIIATHITLD